MLRLMYRASNFLQDWMISQLALELSLSLFLFFLWGKNVESHEPSIQLITKVDDLRRVVFNCERRLNYNQACRNQWVKSKYKNTITGTESMQGWEYCVDSSSVLAHCGKVAPFDMYQHCAASTKWLPFYGQRFYCIFMSIQDANQTCIIFFILIIYW